MKKILYKFLAQEPKELYRIIDKYDVISFDIFDTLIKRNIPFPEDAFKVVGEIFENDADKFYKKRINGEREARKRAKGKEVKLADIYDCLDGYSKDECAELMLLEFEVEKKLCCAYHPIQDLYNRCIEQNKEIILISDMYLSTEQILQLLEICGYKRPKLLYVSCECGLNKSTGRLYSKVREKVGNKRWLHIGDSIKGDYIMSRKEGLNAHLIKRNLPCPTYFPKNKHYDDSNKELFYSFLKTFVQNHEASKANGFERIGYEILGPMLTGFCIWLNKNLCRKNYERVLFFARDSKIILESYKKLFGDDDRCTYFYISRKAAITASVDLAKNYSELHDLLLAKDSAIIDDLCKGLDIKGKAKQNFLKECNVHSDTKVNIDDNFDKKLVYNNAIKYMGLDSKKQRELLVGYLKQEHAVENFAIVDLGWEGRTQWALNRILPNANIDGYYIGIITKCPDFVNSINKTAYFGEMTNTDYNARVIMESIALFESLFLTNEGTTLRYDCESETGRIFPVCGEPDQIIESATKIQMLQTGAKQFVEDICNDTLFNQFDCSSDVIIDLYASFAIRPTKDTVKLLRDLRFRDNGVHIMGAEHVISYYLTRPHALYSDLLHSYYRVLFLKDLLKIDLPYFEMLFRFYRKRH